MSSTSTTFRDWKLPAAAVLCLVFSLAVLLKNLSTTVQIPIVTPPTAQFPHDVAGIGVIEPKSEIINIGAGLPGIVRLVYVKVGDQVKAGVPLFALDERDVAAQIKTLEALLESAKVQAADAEAQFAIVKSIGDKRAVAQDDYNKRKYAAMLAQARITEIQSQLSQAHTTKDRLTIKAPIDGTILSVDVHSGEFAAAGHLAEPMIRMGDMSTLYVRVEIDEENAARVSSGSVARGFVRGNTATPVPLQFVRFEPYIRPKQNLAVSGQHVDTHVLQILYAIGQVAPSLYVGEQMDVFIDGSGEKEK